MSDKQFEDKKDELKEKITRVYFANTNKLRVINENCCHNCSHSYRVGSIFVCDQQGGPMWLTESGNEYGHLCDVFEVKK